MQTSIKAIISFLIASFIGALGQYLYKTGAESAKGGLISYITNPRLLLGVVSYILVMVLFVVAFKFGGALTVLYPVYATTFIWGTIIGALFLGEAISIVKVLGIALIIFGVYLIAR
ncbi:MAG: hypothetical protein FJZ16_06550 [Candidatus Omnitrophica bacterium]|nr:hypothetical protein [Candidatus Omnitrophota bacterium]